MGRRQRVARTARSPSITTPLRERSVPRLRRRPLPSTPPPPPPQPVLQAVVGLPTAGPTLRAASPAGGLPGALISLAGDFGAGPEQVLVRGVSAAIVSASSSRVTIVMPNLTPGPADVTVIVGGRRLTAPGLLEVGAVPNQPPVANLLRAAHVEGPHLSVRCDAVDRSGGARRPARGEGRERPGRRRAQRALAVRRRRPGHATRRPAHLPEPRRLPGDAPCDGWRRGLQHDRPDRDRRGRGTPDVPAGEHPHPLADRLRLRGVGAPPNQPGLPDARREGGAPSREPHPRGRLHRCDRPGGVQPATLAQAGTDGQGPSSPGAAGSPRGRCSRAASASAGHWPRTPPSSAARRTGGWFSPSGSGPARSRASSRGAAWLPEQGTKRERREGRRQLSRK